MRIDKYLSQKYGSRTKSADAISCGLVFVNGKNVSPSYDVREGDVITFAEREESYVSNGGYKLSKALKDFNVTVSGGVFADIGASNGGFTDCLFKNGAKKVYCIDVGENQLDKSLLGKNIVIYDNCNARSLNKPMFAEILDGIVIDVSFISLTLILDAVSEVLCDAKYIIALIKPQFECGGVKVGKRGIVKEPAVHRRVIKKIYDFAQSCLLAPVALTNAPIREGKNKEYLIKLVKNGEAVDFAQLIKNITL